MDKKDIEALISRYASGPLPPWEEHYLDVHAVRYQETLTLLGPGQGRRQLDVGPFQGTLPSWPITRVIRWKALQERAKVQPA